MRRASTSAIQHSVGLPPRPPAEQLARAKTLTARNGAVLGLSIDRVSPYAAHFFGAGMAAKFIATDVNAGGSDSRP